MSLNWSTQKVKYFNDNPSKLYVKISEGSPNEYEDVNPETKGLIFGAMAVGFGIITKDNASEWYARWKMWEKYERFTLYSTFKEDGTCESIYLTPEVILKHIGLSMNVVDETRLNWIKRFIKRNYASSGDMPTVIQAKAMIIVSMMEFDAIVETFDKEMEKV